MFRSINVLILWTLCATSCGADEGKDADVNEMINQLVNALDTDAKSNPTKRITELRDSIAKINQYVIDKDKYDEVLRNETATSNLTKTRFLDAFGAKDDLNFLLEKDSSSLYVKMKEKLTRDDIMTILNEHAARHNSTRRRGLSAGKLEDNPKVQSSIDELMAEMPTDNHVFTRRHSESLFWDPQKELEDREQHAKARTRRLYHGERTKIQYYPFMVSILIMDRFTCGGVIYWRDLVVTSASCLQLLHNNRFYRETPKVLKVRVGSNHSTFLGETIEAMEVYFHPGYEPKTLRHNVAVVRLQRHIHFGSRLYPKAIALDHTTKPVPVNIQVLLLGWGIHERKLRLDFKPYFLRKSYLPVYPNFICKEMYGDNYITESMFCAGTVVSKEGACNNDAGGPAVFSGVLLGLISFGPEVCGASNVPTVFTKIGYYARWIDAINATMPWYHRFKTPTTTTTWAPARPRQTTAALRIKPIEDKRADNLEEFPQKRNNPLLFQKEMQDRAEPQPGRVRPPSAPVRPPPAPVRSPPGPVRPPPAPVRSPPEPDRPPPARADPLAEYPRDLDPELADELHESLGHLPKTTASKKAQQLRDKLKMMTESVGEKTSSAPPVTTTAPPTAAVKTTAATPAPVLEVNAAPDLEIVQKKSDDETELDVEDRSRRFKKVSRKEVNEPESGSGERSESDRQSRHNRAEESDDRSEVDDHLSME